MLRWPQDETTVSSLAERLVRAKPFPHVVLDDVIACEPDSILADFPPGWNTYKEMYQANKRQCGDLSNTKFT